MIYHFLKEQSLSQPAFTQSLTLNVPFLESPFEETNKIFSQSDAIGLVLPHSTTERYLKLNATTLFMCLSFYTLSLSLLNCYLTGDITTLLKLVAVSNTPIHVFGSIKVVATSDIFFLFVSNIVAWRLWHFKI